MSILNKKTSRRRFLSTTGVAASVFWLYPKLSETHGAQVSPNEKLNLAGIGIGSQGGADVDAAAAEGQNIVALCDVDEKYAAKKFNQYPKARRFKDYRLMLDKMDKEIDGVIIGTPDHTHAVIAMEAMRRGKHVYCEKPLAHDIREIRALVDAASKYKVVTQLGNQGHSSNSIRRLCEWVWAGAIGKVHTVHAACDAFRDVYSQIRNLDKINQKYDIPEGLDYDLWLGPAQYRPYTPFWVHWNWRGWLPFGTGTVGDWVCHVLDPSFWALDLDAPASITAEVTDYDPEKHGLTYPPGTKITFDFPAKGDRGPVKIIWFDGKNKIPKPEGFAADDKVPGTGAILFGEKGMIVHGSHGAGGCRLIPEALMEQYSGKNAPPEKIKRVKSHMWDWIDAIKNKREAGSHFAYGAKLTQTALLGVIAIKFPGQTLKWDNEKMRFTNNDAANNFISPPYREGWKL